MTSSPVFVPMLTMPQFEFSEMEQIAASVSASLTLGCQQYP